MNAASSANGKIKLFTFRYKRRAKPYRQARIAGVIPFCITIDRDSEAELKDLYGEVGYTIIDDVLSLPERMPAIYRRLTT